MSIFKKVLMTAIMASALSTTAFAMERQEDEYGCLEGFSNQAFLNYVRETGDYNRLEFMSPVGGATSPKPNFETFKFGNYHYYNEVIQKYHYYFPVPELSKDDIKNYTNIVQSELEVTNLKKKQDSLLQMVETILIQENILEEKDRGLRHPNFQENSNNKKIDLMQSPILTQLDLKPYSISLSDNTPLDHGSVLQDRFKKITFKGPLHESVEKITPSADDSSSDSEIERVD